MSKATMILAALLLSLVASVVGGFVWSASADSEASREGDARLTAMTTELRATEELLAETEERLSEMEESASSTAATLVVVEKRLNGARLVRQCLKEVAQQAQGMSVEYGYASPDQRLSAPCSRFVYGAPAHD